MKWLSDGRLLFFLDVRIGESGAALSVPVGRPAAPETVLSAPSFRINEVAVSPDGQLLAYVAIDRDDTEVIVSKLNGDRFKISSGGVQPYWRRDGRELYFATAQAEIMAVAVSPGPVFGQPSRLMRPCQNTDAPSFSVEQVARKFAMTADGQRVLAICDGVSTPQITVAIGWQSRLQ
jgi:Tol biopolymer transport system component